ncbi:putative pyridoxal 5'-phosphate synthase subunit PDX2 [Vitis vinifera]|uniref:glutaminase n=1 Tax=Vitis vinifera TaxID=29760 RepID=A0A438IKH9_VITVI|nr:putative pyridoxal 5'-phosphate synthase subunit PDX2 [Vitis vinifera]
MAVGVLALQGSFNEHIAGISLYFRDVLSVSLRKLGVKGVEIRKPEQLEQVGSLIIPGGESTTMAKLAEYHNLAQLSRVEAVQLILSFPALREFVKLGSLFGEPVQDLSSWQIRLLVGVPFFILLVEMHL